ncbi:MAG: hypothetical protein KIG22_05455 [Oxalobacter sp.]|uniref:hypothetical protein n=1 Tax=Oxalobacter paeniformigenes TaxID=2946594 RepID=UPI0022AF13D2|nr:hypothetical protein [Oxalobacter paeniformigenes]MBS7405357.1 hypothetical protein [Oxalobacter sp.]MCZ4053590.1 hypothetical protein [Oxalobacter paeniformigenes]
MTISGVEYSSDTSFTQTPISENRNVAKSIQRDCIDKTRQTVGIHPTAEKHYPAVKKICLYFVSEQNKKKNPESDHQKTMPEERMAYNDRFRSDNNFLFLLNFTPSLSESLQVSVFYVK